jgi:serine/threonine protein phosphatase 1
MLIAALAGGDHLALWLANGGSETLASYGVERILEIPRNHLNVIAALPISIDDGVRLFVHAGIDPDAPEARDRSILLWTRKHPDDDASLPRFLVHGHTPVRTGRPDLRPNRLNLDTGAGWGRRLSAAAFRRERPDPIAFLDDLGTVQRLPPVEA